MNFSVLIKDCDGQFEASLVGAPNIRVLQPTRSDTISAIETKIQQSVEEGELLSLDIGSEGISSIAGKCSADPTLADIRDEAYKIRDSEFKT